MSDVKDDAIEQQETVVPEIDYKAELEKMRAELDLVRAKKDELYKETKTAKQQREDALKEAKRIENEKALRDGEYEKLFKQRDEEYKKLEQQLHQDKQDRRKDKIELTASELANELAKGDANKAVLLRRFVADNLSSIADDMGNLDNDTLASIKKQFETDSKYQPLLGGNLSAGGSAPGNTRSVGTSQVMKRAEFDTLPVYKQAEFITKVQQGKAQLTD